MSISKVVPREPTAVMVEAAGVTVWARNELLGEVWRAMYDAAPSMADDDVRAALKQLMFAAQITGGTAGRDESLCAAVDQAERALATPSTGDALHALDAIVDSALMGCPFCGGDCSAANPPVASCPMRAAIRDSATKG
jgi:hypothetical protein